MSITAEFAEIFAEFTQISISSKQLIACMDLTLLDEQADVAALLKLKEKAETAQVAAVCVYPQHLSIFSPLKPIELATVINFPTGTENLAKSLEQILAAKEFGATEIDYVLPYSNYLSGQHGQALEACQAVWHLCHSEQLTLKVIIETGAFADLEILYNLSLELIDIGCDFLKTSTGKISQGASLPAAFTILKAIQYKQKPVGLKVSGGIKTPTQAQEYAQLAELMLSKPIDKTWFRIGASSLLDALSD
ncbi:MAG: deoxyribose-phosphate aldolase [Legionella sp.]|nr:MAG: deoxyribose-phosphate aldolase [Legionella sp.]